MNKKLLIIIGLTIFILNTSHSQKNKNQYSIEFLETLYHNNSCIWNSKLEMNILWTTREGIEFLQNKLKSEEITFLPLAISFLGRSKNPELVKSIESFLSHTDDNVFIAAVQAVVSIDAQKGAGLVDTELLKVDKQNVFRPNFLINILQTLTQKKSEEVLLNFANKCNQKLDGEKKLMLLAIEAAEIIKRFHLSEISRTNLIRDKLYSSNSQNVGWAISKIYSLGEVSYLSLVKEFNNSISNSDRNSLKTQLLKLRKFLGDTDFTKSENKRFEIWEENDLESKNRTLKKRK